MNILDLLKTDHNKVKEIISTLCETSNTAIKTQLKLFNTLKEELELHEKIEEIIFYPALKKHQETKDLVLEAFEEHHVIDLILEELEKTEPKEENWKPKLTVLKENLEHHIKEEENDLFPKTKKVLDQTTLNEMGEKMLLMKKDKQSSPAL
ncbi:MAG: hemerythrin domain-containing protein [Alphaproteobacteria bacterium]|nr:hemerythrin domain-containing protein [Alphaproteobacteria bacterium]